MGVDRGRLGSSKTLLTGIDRTIEILNLLAIVAIGSRGAGDRLAPAEVGGRHPSREK